VQISMKSHEPYEDYKYARWFTHDITIPAGTYFKKESELCCPICGSKCNYIRDIENECECHHDSLIVMPGDHYTMKMRCNHGHDWEITNVNLRYEFYRCVI